MVKFFVKMFKLDPKKVASYVRMQMNSKYLDNLHAILSVFLFSRPAALFFNWLLVIFLIDKYFLYTIEVLVW